MSSRTIGFQAAHEQHAPSTLLDYVRRAEAAGFTAASCSDHFHPWSEREGHAGFSWCWLGAALQATNLPLGVVCAPGPRYHPAVLAQAVATLLEMFPGRFWLAAGSGEALNEKMTGAAWPEKPVRNARLKESVEIMRALWRGETVTHDGLVRVEEAKLYTRSPEMPLVFGTAITESTAEWLGGWADGLLTVGASHENLRKLIDAFRRGGGEGKPLYLQSGISYAKTDEEALAAAHHQWRHAALDPPQLADLPTPRAFDAATEGVRPEQVAQNLRISADLKRHIDWLQQDFELGFSAVFLLNVSRDMERFLSDFGETVLPAVIG